MDRKSREDPHTGRVAVGESGQQSELCGLERSGEAGKGGEREAASWAWGWTAVQVAFLICDGDGYLLPVFPLC